MAEIKSTMDLVMERMAKMTANAPEVSSDEETMKRGMRFAADYLNAKLDDLAGALAGENPKAQQAMYRGAVQTLLRNVVLPRDESLKERSDMALNGVMDIAGNLGVPSISQICTELQQILRQYNQHKEQVTAQLEDALKAQLEQQYSGRGVDRGKIRASMHPKYHDEMARMEQELNGQYNNALQQRRDTILQQLGLA